MDEIRRILDTQAIERLSALYSRACDRMDRELLESVYWPDGTDDHGAFSGSAPDYIEWVMGVLSGMISTHHDNTNIIIDLDGDRATGEVHWTGYYQIELNGESFDQIAVGRYLDRYERRDGEWRIFDRVCVTDWLRTEPTVEDLRERADQRLIGRRGKADLVYQQ